MSCSHPKTKLTLTPHLIHYGRLDCQDCGRFVGWQKNPATILREKETAKKVVFLRDANLPLSEWERGFVADIDQSNGKFSPKQLATIDRLCTTYGYIPQDGN
jgi:hypothetical protein